MATSAGLLFSIWGVWFTLEIFRIGVEFSDQQQKLIDEVRRTVLVGPKFQHLQELRRLYTESNGKGDEELTAYWHFMWRFESYNTLTLMFNDKGFVKVRILGVSNSPLETEYEKIIHPIYSVQVIDIGDHEGLKGGRAYCWIVNGKAYISNEANQIELKQPMYEFRISGLGSSHVRTVGDRPKNFRRLKDVSDLSSANEDQG